MDGAFGRRGCYENSACVNNDNFHRDTSSAMEMGRMVGGIKCCAGHCDRHDDGTPRNLSDVVALSACQPKCPAVKKSPWDPIKTRFAVFLIALLILWIAVGIICAKFGFSF